MEFLLAGVAPSLSLHSIWDVYWVKLRAVFQVCMDLFEECFCGEGGRGVFVRSGNVYGDVGGL